MTLPLVTSRQDQTSPREAMRGERLLILLAALFLVTPFLWEYLFTKTTFPFVDLPSFYFAAKAAFISGRSPFDYSLLSSYELEAGQHIFPFFYNPSSLLFFAPLLAFSYPVAGIAVLVLNHLLALICGYLSLRFFPIRKTSSILIGVALLTLSHPLAINQLSGQINLLVLFCLLLFAHQERKGGIGMEGGPSLGDSDHYKELSGGVLGAPHLIKEMENPPLVSRFSCRAFTLESSLHPPFYLAELGYGGPPLYRIWHRPPSSLLSRLTL